MNIFTLKKKKVLLTRSFPGANDPTVFPCWPRFLCRYYKYSASQTTLMTVYGKPEEELKLWCVF